LRRLSAPVLCAEEISAQLRQVLLLLRRNLHKRNRPITFALCRLHNSGCLMPAQQSRNVVGQLLHVITWHSRCAHAVRSKRNSSLCRGRGAHLARISLRPRRLALAVVQPLLQRGHQRFTVNSLLLKSADLRGLRAKGAAQARLLRIGGFALHACVCERQHVTAEN
jgi:hypothetical protein